MPPKPIAPSSPRQQIDPGLTTPEAIVNALHANPQLRAVLRPILTPRHPSQIYEALLEGVVLFAILWLVRTRTRQPDGVLTGLFFVCYAIFRIVVEYFREPDASLIAGFHPWTVFLLLPHRDRARLHHCGENSKSPRRRLPEAYPSSQSMSTSSTRGVAANISLRTRQLFFFARLPLLLTQDDGPDFPRLPRGGWARFFLRARHRRRERWSSLLLAIGSIFSWSVMVTKMRVVQFARKQTDRFLAAFRQDRQPLRLFESNARFPGSPVFQVYRAGCEELTFHLLGSAEIDETFRARLEIADKITPAQMHAVNAAMERAVGETALKLESQMILLATAVSGAPFLGLLGTVWGVMDTFTGVAEAGSANLAAMAPGVSGALITTVTALCVAIPAMFGYNFLVTSIRGMIVEMDNFAAELASEFEHKYVEHGARVSDFRR